MMPEIPLSGKFGQGLSTLVDEDDYIKYKNNSIWLDKDGYAFTSVKRENNKWYPVRFHRLIMDAPKGMEVDHINHNKIDNRRINLRIVTTQQNQMNSVALSGYKNVSKCSKSTWLVIIENLGVVLYRERFSTEIDAMSGADWAMLKYHGEFANLNDKEFDYTNYTPNPKTDYSSKYVGVTYVKKTNRWAARITINYKLILIGRYLTEEEAAMSRDLYVIRNSLDFELCKPDYPYTEDMYIKTPGDVEFKKSKYIGVSCSYGRYQACVGMGKNKKIHIGMFATDIEAAIARDNYIREHNLDKKLNFPDGIPSDSDNETRHPAE